LHDAAIETPACHGGRFLFAGRAGYPRPATVREHQGISVTGWRASGLIALGLGASLAAGLAMGEEPASGFAAPNLSQSGVRDLASGCAMCHGDEGRPAAGSVIPPLAGRRADAFVDAMNAFRQGRREATVMQQIARAYGDAEIAALAGYFATRAP
jgi:sulfide dehydrogenase cytochrome subunit